MFRTKEQKERKRIEEHLERLRNYKRYYTGKYAERVSELSTSGSTENEIASDPQVKKYKGEINELYDLIKEYEEKLEGIR